MNDHPAPLIITIDGPAGTGKSTVAHRLATELGLDLLDTGAMYRACALLTIANNLSSDEHAAVVSVAAAANIHFDWTTDPPTIIADGEPHTTRLRDPDVSALVSPISKIPGVRELMVERQRDIARRHPRLVTEGRDQGSVVFPDASIKFYLDASVEIRAERRAAQLEQAGHDVDRAAVEQSIRERDHRDATRDIGPLVCPDDAINLVTDDLGVNEVVQTLIHHVREAVPPAALPAHLREPNGSPA